MAKRDLIDDVALESWKHARAEWDGVAGKRLDTLEEAHKFLGGEQWPQEDIKRLKKIRAGALVVPELQSHVDAVAGKETTERFAVNYKPRNPAEPDSSWAHMLNEVGRALLQRAEAEHELSWAYRDMVAGGIGFVTYRYDTDRDPEGMLSVRAETPFQVVYDPFARQQNLTDGRWIAVIRWVPRDSARARWPKIDKAANGDLEDGASTSLIPGSSRNQTVVDEAYSPENNKREVARNRDFKIVHYQWWKPSPFHLWQDPQTGEVRSDTPEVYASIAEALVANGMEAPPYVVRSALRAHEAFICGKTVLEARPCAVNDLPTHAMTCFPRKLADYTEWYGLVDKAKDVQLLMNKLHTLAVHLTAASTKDLVIAEANAFEDWAEAEVAYSSPSRIVKANNGAIAGGKIMVERASGLSPIVSQLLELAGSLVPKATGVNIYQMGAVENLSRTSNAAVQSVQRAGQTVLSQPVDALRRFRARQGRYLAMWVSAMMDERDIARVISPDLAAKIPPKDQWPSLSRFDIVVDEAPSTPNDLERLWAGDQHGLMQGLFADPMYRPEPTTMIDMLPPGIPMELRERWKNDIKMRMEAQAAQAAAAEEQPPGGGEMPAEGGGEM